MVSKCVTNNWNGISLCLNVSGGAVMFFLSYRFQTWGPFRCSCVVYTDRHTGTPDTTARCAPMLRRCWFDGHRGWHRAPLVWLCWVWGCTTHHWCPKEDGSVAAAADGGSTDGKVSLNK
jgi:hypothetical protein